MDPINAMRIHFAYEPYKDRNKISKESRAITKGYHHTQVDINHRQAQILWAHFPVTAILRVMNHTQTFINEEVIKKKR